MAGRTIRVLVVGGRRLLAEALADALGRERGIATDGPATGVEDALAGVSRRPPDVVVVDLALPGGEAGPAIRRLLDVAPGTRVLAIGDPADQVAVGRAVEAGAAGHVPVDAGLAELVAAVRRAAAGEPVLTEEDRRRVLRRLRHQRAERASAEQRLERLTARELQILQLMADGATAPQVAERLGIRRATQRTHVHNIITKLGVHSKTAALALAIRHGRVAPRG